MSQDFQNNPFAQLFPTVDAARMYSEQCELSAQKEPEVIKMDVDESSSISTEEPSIPAQYVNVNEKIEKIFGISLNKCSKNKVIYLKDLSADLKQIWIDLDILEQVLFERLLLKEPSTHLLNGNPESTHVIERQVIIYLNQCYWNIKSVTNSQPACENNVLNSMVNLILRNISTALKQPELYSDQDLAQQLCEVFGERSDPNSLPDCVWLLNGLVSEMIKDEEDPTGVVHQAFLPLLKCIHRHIAKGTLTSLPSYHIFGGLEIILHNKLTADALITYTTPAVLVPGNVFANTLIGAMLCLSCLPKINKGNFHYFKKDDIGHHVETAVWTATQDINTKLYKMLFQLLKVSPEVKEKTIKWISSCLSANADRGKLLSTQGIDPFADMTGSRSVSDAFMLNLGAVLLRLCEPIISDPSGKKILKIDPTFGAADEFKKETCLITADSPENRPKSEVFNFVTVIFFLTHRAIDLGFRVSVERLVRLNQDLQRLIAAERDAQAAGAPAEVIEVITRRMEIETTRFMTLRAALLEPATQDLLVNLNVATCKWIVQVVLDLEPEPRENYQIARLRTLTFPLPEQVAPTLACIPEFFIENLNCYVPFARRFKAQKLEGRGLEVLEPIVTLIVVLTRGNKRVKNPHLRAGLIESLEGLLPKSTFSRTQVFHLHPHSQEIIPSLLDVFVSIEMTGESVQFDQKFKYRRPIYVLMDFLWKSEVHRECFKNLADDAEKNMEAVTPPIFLRFLNLLINDAVYLLDEALSNMAQLKTLQAARGAGKWASLPAREREEMEALLHHTGMIARFDNILGKWTIRTLEFLTTEIKSIFAHPTMVDRVAAMLNYFLHNLVGPKKKNLKVKDQAEFEFRPGDLVLAICQIYANLSESDAFCLAISQDGRSYNEKLFVQAEEVLCRIDGSALVPEIRSVAARVSELASRQRRQDELMADAPDEFLDPIMSTLMTDPVILPSSHVTVDRPTIARHLLSDQSDPFNRALLTMDMVKPNEELRQRIRTWMEGRREKQDPSTEM